MDCSEISHGQVVLLTPRNDVVKFRLKTKKNFDKWPEVSAGGLVNWMLSGVCSVVVCLNGSSVADPWDVPRM